MDKQIIISISREYGSGGHYIADRLAKELNMEILDHNLLDQIAAERDINLEEYKKYDEAPKKRLFTRTVRGLSNSMEDIVAEMQFDYIKEKAATGKSMIIVGRCADALLKDYKGLIKIFIEGDMKDKVDRIKYVRKMDTDEAKRAIERHDNNRRRYHNMYCDTKWGDSRYYDICINSSRLGLDETEKLLKDYILKYAEKL